MNCSESYLPIMFEGILEIFVLVIIDSVWPNGMCCT